MTLGGKIKETRLRRGLSQKDLGLLVGYSAMGISLFESGKRPMNEDVLEKIENALGGIEDFVAPNRKPSGKAENIYSTLRRIEEDIAFIKEKLK